MATLAAVSVAGVVVGVRAASDGPASAQPPTAGTSVPADAAATPTPSVSTPSPPQAAAPRTAPSRTAPKKAQVKVPAKGPKTYAKAQRAVKPATGKGAVIRYDVRVEKNLKIDPDQAAVFMQRVLNDRRSWTGSGRWRFQLVKVGQQADLHAYLVTPGTTDALCAPLRTRGEVSCQNGNKVVLNAKRWVFGAKAYGADVTAYRTYLVNHEFGHFIGYQHVGCAGKGKVAGVMMQQTKGLQGCKANPWPAPRRR